MPFLSHKSRSSPGHCSQVQSPESVTAYIHAYTAPADYGYIHFFTSQVRYGRDKRLSCGVRFRPSVGAPGLSVEKQLLNGFGVFELASAAASLCLSVLSSEELSVPQQVDCRSALPCEISQPCTVCRATFTTPRLACSGPLAGTPSTCQFGLQIIGTDAGSVGNVGQVRLGQPSAVLVAVAAAVCGAGSTLPSAVYSVRRVVPRFLVVVVVVVVGGGRRVACVWQGLAIGSGSGSHCGNRQACATRQGSVARQWRRGCWMMDDASN